jgi:alpha-L-glutamate ligase-like protein
MLGFNPFRIHEALQRRGIVGLNRRNAAYIMEHNARRYYPLVDDKLKTKELARKASIDVPDLYLVIRTQHDANNLDELLKDSADFVIKPAHGAGGDGVMVITGRRNELYRKASGVFVDGDEMRYYASNILSGTFSLGGHPDQAIVEYRVKSDPIFDQLSYQGVPDIRMVVYRGVPIMAMLRLPTRQSDGKANLHQGAVGVGIEIGSGVTTDGVWLNRTITEHPDYDTKLAGLSIPHWDRLLILAARSYELAPLGYLGVDIVLDRHRGPLVLELNARPGLSIQIANRQGLDDRVTAVNQVEFIPDSAETRAMLACELFSDHELHTAPVTVIDGL